MISTEVLSFGGLVKMEADLVKSTGGQMYLFVKSQCKYTS